MAEKIRVPRFAAKAALIGALLAMPLSATAVHAPAAQAAPVLASAPAAQPAFQPAWCHHWGCGEDWGWHHRWGGWGWGWPGWGWPGWGGDWDDWGTGSGVGLPGIYVGS